MIVMIRVTKDINALVSFVKKQKNSDNQKNHYFLIKVTHSQYFDPLRNSSGIEILRKSDIY